MDWLNSAVSWDKLYKDLPKYVKDMTKYLKYEEELGDILAKGDEDLRLYTKKHMQKMLSGLTGSQRATDVLYVIDTQKVRRGILEYVINDCPMDSLEYLLKNDMVNKRHVCDLLLQDRINIVRLGCVLSTVKLEDCDSAVCNVMYDLAMKKTGLSCHIMNVFMKYYPNYNIIFSWAKGNRHFRQDLNNGMCPHCVLKCFFPLSEENMMDNQEGYRMMIGMIFSTTYELEKDPAYKCLLEFAINHNYMNKTA